jgi:hypothetical protein
VPNIQPLARIVTMRNGTLSKRRKSAMAIFNRYVLVTVRRRDERVILIMTRPLPNVPRRKSMM